jgi:hypothetical protein
MTEIEMLVQIRDRINLLLGSKDPMNDLQVICEDVLKSIEDRLAELQKQLNALA